MSILQIAIIGLGLAMDAFAVSITSGITIHKMHLRHALLIAFFFGIFQAVMPVFGWTIGQLAADHIKAYDHWLVFAMLLFIGGKMIYEAYQFEEAEKKSNPLNIYILFMLALATSLDALAVGVSFSFLDVEILSPVLLIGLITFIMSFAGTYIGNYFGHLFEKKLEVLGGLILIGIGTKILLQHTIFS